MFGYPNNYNYPTYMNPIPTNGTHMPNNGIQWVQGVEAAKSYLVGAGQSVLLMDSENSCFYIKSTDQSGMPLPLRIFDYTERATQPANNAISPQMDMSAYVTHDELQRFADELKASLRPEGSLM